MLQIVNTLKSKFSFVFLEIISVVASPLAYFVLSKKDPTGISLFVLFVIVGGFSTFVIILYILELIFPKFRIPKKMKINKIFSVIFYTLLPITAIVIGLAIIPIIMILFYVLIIPFAK